jgi:N-acetylglutamate synthase-like GNAT family acetyltransferase
MIREAQPSDRGLIFDLLMRMHAETMFSVFDVSEARLREAVEDFLLPDIGLFTCVIEADGAIQGVFFGHIGSMWFSDDLCGFDDVWYVSPEYRGTIESVRMLRRFEWWCKDSGCKAALVGVSSGVMVDRTSAILERLGYGRLGGLFRRDF